MTLMIVSVKNNIPAKITNNKEDNQLEIYIISNICVTLGLNTSNGESPSPSNQPVAMTKGKMRNTVFPASHVITICLVYLLLQNVCYYPLYTEKI